MDSLTEYFEPVEGHVLLELPSLSLAEKNSNDRNVRDVINAVPKILFVSIQHQGMSFTHVIPKPARLFTTNGNVEVVTRYL